MGIAFGPERSVQRPSDRLDLIRAVVAAHASDESDWIEWKREVALDTPPGRFEAARHIIGFANRLPVAARRFAQGHAFLLVGVEPGSLIGTRRMDPAALEDALRPYVGGDGPVWDPHFVEVDGLEVLLIDVAPPAQGDAIHSMRKGFDKVLEGTVFIRRHGQTVTPPSPDELRALTVRANPVDGADQRVEVDVRWQTDEVVVHAVDLADSHFGHVEEFLHERFPTPSGLGALDATGVGESRKPNEYLAEIDAYIQAVRKIADQLAVAEAIRRRVMRCTLEVSNPTDKNFGALEVTLALDDLYPYDENDAASVVPPTAPRVWGVPPAPTPLWALSNVATATPVAYPTFDYRSPPLVHIERGPREPTLTFPAFDLRPRAVYRHLPAFHLFALPWLAGSTVEIRWSATSTGATGVAEGTLPVKVSDEPITLDVLVIDLLAKRLGASDDE